MTTKQDAMEAANRSDTFEERERINKELGELDIVLKWKSPVIDYGLSGTIGGASFELTHNGRAWWIGIGGSPDEAPEWEDSKEWGNLPVAALYHDSFYFLIESARKWLAARPTNGDR